MVVECDFAANFSGTFWAKPSWRSPQSASKRQVTTRRAAPRTLLEYTNPMCGIRTAVTAFLLAVPCLAQRSDAAPPIPHFEDVSKQAGLTVPHNSTPEKRYILESMSGGVGFIDCDNDGKLDIITVNGSSVDRYRQGGDLMITLYRQDGDLQFRDITKEAG